VGFWKNVLWSNVTKLDLFRTHGSAVSKRYGQTIFMVKHGGAPVMLLGALLSQEVEILTV